MPAQARSTSSVSAAPQMPVRRILALSTMAFAMSRSAAPCDVDVADAVEMREDRHARLVLHARHEALAAARHDHVDVAVEARQHRADRRAVAGRHKVDRVGRAGPPARAPRPSPPRWRATMRKLSEPPRRIAALPALRQSAPASAVTFGRLSKMTPMTPSGVAHPLDHQSVRPRRSAASTRPTGSGSAAMLSTACGHILDPALSRA